jgi:hypothetical protein
LGIFFLFWYVVAKYGNPASHPGMALTTFCHDQESALFAITQRQKVFVTCARIKSRFKKNIFFAKKWTKIV